MSWREYELPVVQGEDGFEERIVAIVQIPLIRFTTPSVGPFHRFLRLMEPVECLYIPRILQKIRQVHDLCEIHKEGRIARAMPDAREREVVFERQIPDSGGGQRQQHCLG